MTVHDGIDNLLIIENEKTVRRVLKKILEITGYKVFIADNGEEALGTVREHSEIALLIFDLVLPGRDDRELLARIRAVNPGVKTLLISAYPEDMLHEQDLIPDDVIFMTKPFSLNIFLINIRELLQGNRSGLGTKQEALQTAWGS